MTFRIHEKQAEGKVRTSAPALTRTTKGLNPMAKATRVHSTPPTNTSATSRGGFLAQSAAAAADPVYAMIESHKSLSVAYDKAVNHPAVGNSRHPQCAKAERISNRAMNELLAQTKRLFAFKPSTSAGVAALLRYISSLQVWQLPGCFSESREIKGMKNLCRSMAVALEAADGKAVQS
jgi:hypothetical protein